MLETGKFLSAKTSFCLQRLSKATKASKGQNLTQHLWFGWLFILNIRAVKRHSGSLACNGNEMSNVCLTTVNSTTAFLLNHPSVAPMYSYNIFTNTWSKNYQQIPISNVNGQIISCVLYQGKNYQRYRLFFVSNTRFCINLPLILIQLQRNPCSDIRLVLWFWKSW